MMITSAKRRHAESQTGFSLVELLVVIAIILVVSAVAIPNIRVAMAQLKLRSTATDLSGIVQQARLRSVRDNRIYEIVIGPSPWTPTRQAAWVDLNGNGVLDGGEPAIELADGVAFQPACAPCITQRVIDPNMGAAQTFFLEPPGNPFPAFNQRGLPCEPVAGSKVGGFWQACSRVNGGLQVGYVVYLQSNSPLLSGTTDWAAVTVTPAGRIKAWTYSGTWN
jgi:prepilin-type N-terminal cleavage/methylation domain-containing protein